jgi:hypothetical protein
MSRRRVGAIGGAIGSAVLAGALAATINLGILRAAGPMRGPRPVGPRDDRLGPFGGKLAWPWR